MGGWRTASVKMQHEPAAEVEGTIRTIRTNQNWYKILKTRNKQFDIKGENA